MGLGLAGCARAHAYGRSEASAASANASSQASRAREGTRTAISGPDGRPDGPSAAGSKMSICAVARERLRENGAPGGAGAAHEPITGISTRDWLRNGANLSPCHVANFLGRESGRPPYHRASMYIVWCPRAWSQPWASRGRARRYLRVSPTHIARCTSA